MMQAMGRGGRGDETNVFETARRLTELDEEKQGALQILDDQHALEQAEAIAELNRQLNKKYMALVLELLPEADKPKYEKVIAAMMERDEARAAARKALVTVLEEVRTKQGAERQGPIDAVPFGKTDIIRRYFKLSDDQRAQADELRRDGFAAMREEMRDIERPADFRDPAALQTFIAAMRKARSNVDAQAAEGMAKVLDEKQKADYDVAAKAYDDYQAKIEEIDKAYEAALVAAVGEEKAKELQQRRPMFGGFRGRQPGGGDRRPQGGGERPARGADF